MTKSWPIALALFVFAGCSYGPRDTQYLTSKTQQVQFSGLLPARQEVTFYAYDNSTGTWQAFGAAAANGNSYQDAKGATWYEYNTSLQLPQEDKYWQLGCCTTWPDYSIKIKTRMSGYDLFTFDTDSSDACLSANYGSLGGLELGNKCKTRWLGDGKTAVLRIKEGGNGQPCGDKNWIQGPCQTGLFCGSDNLCHDESYCPAGKMARYDGVCETPNWSTAAGITEVYDFPNDAGWDWTDRLQGVASDGSSWYITQTETIRKVPFSQNLNADLNGYPRFTFWTGTPAGINHMGDLDYYQGNLYVPLEGAGGHIAEVASSNLAVRSFVRIPNNFSGSAPWVAINPKNGYLYTSDYTTNKIRVFKRSYSGNQLVLTELPNSLKILDESGNPIQISRIGGAAFSPSGKLYLASDNLPDWGNPAPFHGLYGFQISPLSARMMVRVPIQAGYREAPGGFGFTGDEIEGISIEDITWTNGIRTHIHVLMVDVDSATDDVYFKHFKVSDPAKL